MKIIMISCLDSVEQEHRNTCKVKQIFIEWPSYAYAKSADVIPAVSSVQCHFRISSLFLQHCEAAGQL